MREILTIFLTYVHIFCSILLFIYSFFCILKISRVLISTLAKMSKRFFSSTLFWPHIFFTDYVTFSLFVTLLSFSFFLLFKLTYKFVQTNNGSHFNLFYNWKIVQTTSLSVRIPPKKLSSVNQHHRKRSVKKNIIKRKRVISPLTNPYSVFVLSRLFLNPLIAHNILINKEQCTLVLPFV